MTFRYLEPPKLRVVKVGQIEPTVVSPEETVTFLGVKNVVPSSTLKMRKSKKKSARVYAYTHAYTQLREGGGKFAPRVK